MTPKTNFFSHYRLNQKIYHLQVDHFLVPHITLSHFQ